MKSSMVGLAFTTAVLANTTAQQTATTTVPSNMSGSIDGKRAAAAEHAAGSFALKGKRNLQEKTAPPVIASDLAPSASAGVTCSNGIAGIDGSNSAGISVCCPEECGQCGGSGCGSAGLPTYDNTGCCVNGINANQEDCTVTGAAPCINTYPECTGYKPWIGDGYCDDYYGLNNAACGYDAGDCCECECEDSTHLCGIVGYTCVDPEADTTCTDDSRCSNGLDGIQGSNSAGDTVCCPAGCGQCGGAACGSAGLPDFTNEDCCVNGVVRSQGACSDTGAAPCVITERCSNDVVGIGGSNVLGDQVCCPVACGICSGSANSGCDSSGLPDYGSESCCVNNVVGTQESCSETGTAPCIIVESDYSWRA